MAKRFTRIGLGRSLIRVIVISSNTEVAKLMWVAGLLVGPRHDAYVE